MDPIIKEAAAMLRARRRREFENETLIFAEGRLKSTKAEPNCSRCGGLGAINDREAGNIHCPKCWTPKPIVQEIDIFA